MTNGITDLQLSLIVIGVLSVGGVWGYNLWQERKHRKAAQVLFGATRKDVLLDRPADDATSSAGTPVAEDGFAEERIERIEPVILTQEPALSPLAEDDAPRSLEARSAGEFGEIAEPTEETAGHEKISEIAEITEDTGIAATVAATEKSSAISPASPLPEAVLPVDDLPVLEEEAIVRSSPVPAFAPDMALTNEADRSARDAAQTPDSEPAAELADPVIDCVVQIHAGEMISAPLLWAGQRQLFGRLAGRLCWSGLDENTGSWQRLHVHDPNSYQRLVAALQLADRNGPVAADDIALFCDGVRQLATHYHAQAIVPVVSEVMARAHALDAFCASVDWRLVMHLAAGGNQGRGLRVDDIGQMAAVAGLQKSPVREDGTLHALDPQGQTQFTLGLPAKILVTAEDEDAGDEVAHVVLTMDVPRVADGVAAFDRMMHLAQIMATRLDAVLVDDRGKPLGQEVQGMIREKIAEFQQNMTEHQIPAGSRRALRLYA